MSLPLPRNSSWVAAEYLWEHLRECDEHNAVSFQHVVMYTFVITFFVVTTLSNIPSNSIDRKQRSNSFLIFGR